MHSKNTSPGIGTSQHTVQYSTQHITEHSKLHHSTTQHKQQHIKTLHRTKQHNTAQHNTTQHNTTQLIARNKYVFNQIKQSTFNLMAYLSHGKHLPEECTQPPRTGSHPHFNRPKIYKSLLVIRC